MSPNYPYVQATQGMKISSSLHLRTVTAFLLDDTVWLDTQVLPETTSFVHNFNEIVGDSTLLISSQFFMGRSWCAGIVVACPFVSDTLHEHPCLLLAHGFTIQNWWSLFIANDTILSYLFLWIRLMFLFGFSELWQIDWCIRVAEFLKIIFVWHVRLKVT